MHDKYVRIVGVRDDDRGEKVIDAVMDGKPMTFRPHELTRYVI